jgi:UDPglucose 6-dehydrogenase
VASICVVGAWHQAAVAAAGLSELGHAVRGVDGNAAAVARLAAGTPPVEEPGLPDLLLHHLGSGHLRYTPDFVDALRGADAALVAIDTPVGADDSPDLASVFEAVDAIANGLSGDLLLIIGAQVPVGTCHALTERVRALAGSHRVDVAYVPEFLRLGNAVELFLHPDRLVIGADDPAVRARVAQIYRGVDAPVVETGLRTAEMIKHASNAFLAASVSFANEIAGLCEESGADALAVAQAMRLDRRIGPHAFLSPGLGFAGGTLGRDVRALQALGRATARPTRLLDAVMAVNADQTRLVVARLERRFPDLRGVSIGLLGLTYKPGTSALRRSAGLETAEALLARGARVRAFDPMVPPDRSHEVPAGLELVADPIAAADGAAALALMTEWPEFQRLDWGELAARAAAPRVLIDARNALDPATVAQAGFDYWGVGRAARRAGADRSRPP